MFIGWEENLNPHLIFTIKKNFDINFLVKFNIYKRVKLVEFTLKI